jgi:hypothetical protein
MATAILRNAAKKAGVHLYAPIGDIVFAGKHFLGVEAGFDGEHEICLPSKCKVVDLLTEEIVGKSIDKFATNLKYGECALFGLFEK